MDDLLVPFVAVTDSPAGTDLSIEREVLGNVRIEKVPTQPRQAFIDALSDADAVLCMHTRLDRDVIRSLHRCEVIARYGTGLDNIDLAAARDAGIPVCGVNDYCTEEVANHTLALLLAWNRKVLAYHRFVQEGRWNERPFSTGQWGCGPISRLSGQTLGLVGFGHIGQAVAQRARVFDMDVLAWSRNPDPEAASGIGVDLVDRAELMRRSDYLSLHVPLSDATYHLIDGNSLDAMKPGAVLINTARGELVNEAALADRLASGALGGALLDVYREAPLPMDHPFRRLDNVILTPHVAFYSDESLHDLRRSAAEVVRQYL
jgi:D-3-phosphoglycerate dehydrogenase / 2-oxoglutarate reductase